MSKNISAIFFLTAIVSISSPILAAVQLAGIFGDHMVLQEDAKLPIWGTADAKETVHVTITGGDKQTLADGSVTADAQGRWRVDLPPIKPTASAVELTVAGSNTIKVTDILIGEVWLCSGQSNMEYSLKTAETGKQQIAQADYPDIRLCIVGNHPSPQPQSDREATWVVCSPQTCGKFSAVGFFFGKSLHDALKKPVGLIESSVAGTPAQSWTPLEAMKSDPVLKHYADEYQNAPAFNAGVPSSLYNGIIAPLIPLAIKGAVWYQGESNTDQSAEYKDLFPTLIRAWRTQWGEGDFPFLFVQLPGFGRRGPATQPSSWALMREAQASALSLPATAMAVTLDLSVPRAILHPKNKFNVGVRLALAAENMAYAMDVPYQGPTFDSMKIEGNKIRIHFKNATGLVAHAAPTDDPSAAPPAPADKVHGFQIAGDDKNFVPADAAIDSDSVVVSSDSVKTPVAIRFGWEQNPEVNLYNAAGLPAGPFRTDNWGQ